MTITLNNQYRLTSDERNIILEKKRITSEKSKKPGEEIWDTIGYYSNISQAVKAIIDKHIQTTEVEGIQNIIEEIKSVQQAITSVIEVEK